MFVGICFFLYQNNNRCKYVNYVKVTNTTYVLTVAVESNKTNVHRCTLEIAIFLWKLRNGSPSSADILVSKIIYEETEK